MPSSYELSGVAVVAAGGQGLAGDAAFVVIGPADIDGMSDRRTANCSSPRAVCDLAGLLFICVDE